jgi:quercetin dioxygenase-like cupin family protein
MTEDQGHSYTREHPLSGEVLQLDLKAEGRALLAEARRSPQGRAARTLVKEGALRLTLLALREGAVLSDHRAAGPVAIQVLAGAANVRSGTGTHRLTEQEAVVFDANVTHALEADGDCLILLTIAMPE